MLAAGAPAAAGRIGWCVRVRAGPEPAEDFDELARKPCAISSGRSACDGGCHQAVDARMSQAGIEKSAALLLTLGEEATAAVFRYLSPLEVSRLGGAMRELGVLPRERVRAILREYAAEAAEQTGFAADAGRFLEKRSLELAGAR
jgi:hypothetical protein